MIINRIAASSKPAYRQELHTVVEATDEIRIPYENGGAVSFVQDVRHTRGMQYIEREKNRVVIQ